MLAAIARRIREKMDITRPPSLNGYLSEISFGARENLPLLLVEKKVLPYRHFKGAIRARNRGTRF